MLAEELGSLVTHTKKQVDLLALVTQHPRRPEPRREYDQIYMLPGSQLTQAKLISTYLRGSNVVLLGDGDCMSLVLGLLGERKVLELPAHMLVLDFDERILSFINQTVSEFRLPADLIETARYNVRYPIPPRYSGRSDVFYTNPPYGSANKGESGKIFLGRCMELCKSVGSSGVVILPFEPQVSWSRDAMANVQGFLLEHGYVVAEMIRGVHQYHLEDRPELLSGTVIIDRVNAVGSPYAGRTFDQPELEYFYGRTRKPMPDYIDLDGRPVYAEGEKPVGGRERRSRENRGRQ